MAQKQYEMLFQLNAKLGSQYSTTLKAAQSELLRFNQEYKALASTAGDISAYQRQQAAVENTKDKLALLQQQYDNIQREMDETGTYSSDLENKLLSKRAQIEKTTKAFSDQTARLDEYKRRLEEAGVDTSELDKESERLKNELKQLQSGFDGAGDEAKEFGDKGANSLQNIETLLVSAGIVKGLKAIYEGFSECTKVTADFEQQMSNVEAIAGSSEEEIAALTERAKELGASTAFTAQQVGEGMEYMAMAGWKTEDMLEGMDAVLALAAASGEDLGTVSDIVTDALTAFGLKAKDTGRFADILAATAANANTNVGMMGETFKYAAPVAGALGYSVEDVAVAIGLMANSGIKASQAGTTLRNIFNGILGSVDLTGKAFGELNVSFVKSDGTMMDLASSMDTLRYYFDQMTEAEKVQNAINIAGQRGYSGLLAILNSTTEDYQKLTKAVNESSGAAQKMANIKLDNMNGQLTIAKSAWEGLQMAIGEEFTPVLTRLFKVAAGVIGKVTEFIKANPEVVKAIALVAAGIGAFVVIITAAKVAMAAFNAVAAMNPFVLIAAAVTAAVAALGILAVTADDAIDPMKDLVSTSQEQADRLEELRAEYEAVAEAEGETSVNAILLKKEIDEQTEAFENNKQTLQEFIDAQNEIHDAHEKLMSDYADTTKGINQDHDSTESLIIKLQELASKANLSSGELKVLQAVIEELNKMLPDANITYDVSTGKLNVTTEDLKAMADAAAEARQQAADLDQLINSAKEEKLLEKAVADAQAAYDAQKRLTDEAWADYQASKRTFQSAYGEQAMYDVDLFKAYEAESSALEILSANLDREKTDLAKNRAEQERLSAALGASATAVEEESTYIYQMQDVLASYNDRIETLTQSYLDAYNAAYDSITGQYKLWDEVAEVSAKSVEDVTTSLQNQKKYWEDYNTNIQTLLSFSGEIEGLSDMVAAFGDGSADSVNMVAGMAEAAKSGDPTKIQALVTAWQENKKAQDEAAESLGDLVTGYSDQMAEIKDQIAADVEGMDFSAESYSAAQATIEAFIAGAGDMMPAVQRAYAQLAAVANNALTQSYYRQYYSYRSDHGQAYASGTDNASPGLHLVGEYGPEIVALHGGERVLDADRTRDLLEALQPREPLNVALPAPSSFGAEKINFNNTFQIQGASNPEEFLDMLPEITRRLREEVVGFLDEREYDKLRRRL